MMRRKEVKCPSCGGDRFRLIINIYESARNELHLKCEECKLITKMKIGDKK